MLDPKMKASEMDLRSYFAAMAMQGMMSLGPREMIHMADPKMGTVGEWVSENSVAVADALILELNRTEDKKHGE